MSKNLTQEEVDALWQQHIRQQFKLYKETGRLDIDFPTMQFKLFQDRGMITISEDERDIMWNKALKKFMEVCISEKARANSSFKRNALSEAAKRVEAGKPEQIDLIRIKQLYHYEAIKLYYDNIETIF